MPSLQQLYASLSLDLTPWHSRWELWRRFFKHFGLSPCKLSFCHCFILTALRCKIGATSKNIITTCLWLS